MSLHAPLREPLFFCAMLDGADEVVLSGDEANHVRAQRLKPGDTLALFDGRGQIARGTVQSIARREVGIALAKRWHESLPVPDIELCCAAPKGDRIAVLLDMATQLGMSRFTPVRWSRAVVEPGARAAERWQRVCLEACKQSRRLHLPEIGEPVTLTDAIANARADGSRLLLADPGGRTASKLPPDLAGASHLTLFVGPEGGLVDDELALLRDAGAYFFNLGEGILRIETAAVALIAAVNALKDTPN